MSTLVDESSLGRFEASKTLYVICLVFAWACLLGAPIAWGDQLSEADVIRLVRTHNPDAASARAAVAIAEAESISVGLYPNPQVSWDRESFSDAGESEDSLLITVPIELSPRRSTESHLARAHVATANAEAARTTSAAVARGLALFYDLIADQKRGEIQARALARLNQAADVMKRRKEEGAASGYEQARIEVEAEFAASALRQIRARTERRRKELALTLGADPVARFTGALDADANLKSLAVSDGQERAASRPSATLLRSAVSKAEQASDTAAQTWIPDLAITAGPRLRTAHEASYGYVAGLTLDLPFFSRGQGLRAQSQARQRHAQARAKAAARAADIEVVGAQHMLMAAMEEARIFDEATRDRVERLERAAESGYREGQRSLVELLDARRARTAVDFRRLELSLSIKRAEIAFRAARGDFE